MVARNNAKFFEAARCAFEVNAFDQCQVSTVSAVTSDDARTRKELSYREDQLGIAADDDLIVGPTRLSQGQQLLWIWAFLDGAVALVVTGQHVLEVDKNELACGGLPLHWVGGGRPRWGHESKVPRARIHAPNIGEQIARL